VPDKLFSLRYRKMAQIDHNGKFGPLITVAIPTYKRPDLLQRAVESVLRQTYSNWELVISDDELEEGATWAYLQEIASQEPRMRLLKNKGVHGQIGNTNHLLRSARGEWIKLLHDDDVLKEDCLEELVKVLALGNNVVCVVCGVEKYVDGELRSSTHNSGWPLLEIIPQDQVHLGMYLNENMGGALPSQKLIRRSVVDQNVLMEPYPGIRLMVDSIFNARIAQHGSIMIYRKPLVEWHQGLHETQTTEISDAEHDRETMIFREYVYNLVPPGANVPNLEAAKGMVRLQRALWRLKKRRVGEFVTQVCDVKTIGSYRLLLRWIIHSVTRGRVSSAKREVLRK
jgi:glycosyltransferase involved in cell wall biosynthesis